MTNSIKSKKELVPTILGLALLAVVLVSFGPISALADSAKDQKMPQITGSVNVAKTLKDYIKQQRTTSFAEAATTAEHQVSNGAVMGGHTGVVQGYLVYTFCVVDTDKDTSYFVIIDDGNGKVLNKSDGISMKDMGVFEHGFGGHGFGEHHGFGGKMMPHNWSDKTDSENPVTPENQ